MEQDDATSDLSQRMLSSDAVKSLLAEGAVFTTLERLGWLPFNGAFYNDVITGKPREIDIFASQRWIRRHSTEPEITVDLHMIVECKSISGYSLIFPPAKQSRLLLGPRSAWFGRVPSVRDAVTPWLLQGGVPDVIAAAYCREAEQAFVGIAFPDGESIVADFMIQPLAIDHLATTFREANPKVEKDAESSVVWKASSALNSALAGLTDHYVDSEALEAATSMRLAVGEGSGLDEAVSRALSSAVRSLSIFHPVITVEAPMWLLRPDGLEPISRVRLVQQVLTKGTLNWVDVVSTSAIDAFLEEISDYYATRLNVLHASRVHLDALYEIIQKLRAAK